MPNGSDVTKYDATMNREDGAMAGWTAVDQRSDVAACDEPLADNPRAVIAAGLADAVRRAVTAGDFVAARIASTALNQLLTSSDEARSG